MYVMSKMELDSPDGEEKICIEAAYTKDGHYIGTEATAEFLYNRGIKPELASKDHNICSIGFCEKEQKWYGWSHRAIAGFGIGSEVELGDCAYVPKDEEDALNEATRFWSEDCHTNVSSKIVDHFNPDLNTTERMIETSWTYTDDIPNEKLRGTTTSILSPIPEFGRGQWTAKTLEDAKEMAIAYAESIS